ncbi:hypothetical protein K438DRAFT_1825778 [Mycena galopus ATCC 62051]|nr:hypothetical protein K438DRAFT_1887332 [Mycena galopus ATCC 62051]KAF8196916.1 hypothetical protein K438DRAFT_1825778 [Mycena galopus ATCC 62051]
MIDGLPYALCYLLAFVMPVSMHDWCGGGVGLEYVLAISWLFNFPEGIHYHFAILPRLRCLSGPNRFLDSVQF